MVACHAVFQGFDYTKPEADESWYLLDYQRVGGPVGGKASAALSFLQHIQLGVEEAARDPSALLLFSGGQTRKDAGPRSEAEGYWLVAAAKQWFGHSDVRGRTFTEEHARDSFENLLFSLCRFHELTGHYPANILVISYEFKAFRFANVHAAALRWPGERFRFLGTPALNPTAFDGEAKTVEGFRRDPYGCKADLRRKKQARDPFAQGPYAGARCPAMARLLTYCGPDIYKGALPWK